MELVEVIKARRAIRKFKANPVPENLITELLEAARLAPSGVNIHPWRFVVVKSAEARAKLKEATPLPFVPAAPVVIACCVDSQAIKDTGDRPVKLNMDPATAKAYLNLNAAIAIEHIALRAVDLGLGSCWVMMFDRGKIKNVLSLEDRYDVVALIPVGYPDERPEARPRLAMDEILIKEL